MSLIATAPPKLSKQPICEALGQPLDRCYGPMARGRPGPPGPDRRRCKVAATDCAPVRRLSAEQDEAILSMLHGERFIDASPRRVYAQLLRVGVVLASASTFYRRLRALGQTAPPGKPQCQLHLRIFQN